MLARVVVVEEDHIEKLARKKELHACLGEGKKRNACAEFNSAH